MSESPVNSMNCHPDQREGLAVCLRRENAASSRQLFPGMTILLIVGLALSASGYAEGRVCNATDAQHADAAVDTLHSWDSLYKWYRSYAQCDDGGAAEGVSEAVARNLVDRWESLSRLSQLAKNDPHFHVFVLKHIDETLNEDDLKKIRSNASTRCPRGLRSLCDSLQKQAGSS